MHIVWSTHLEPGQNQPNMEWIYLDSKVSVFWPQLFIFLIDTTRIFFYGDTPHKLLFQRCQLHWLNWILCIFIRLTSGRMVEWRQQLWQCWKKSMNGTGGWFKHCLWIPDTEWKKRCRNENTQGVLAKSHYSCIYNSLTCHTKFFLYLRLKSIK